MKRAIGRGFIDRWSWFTDRESGLRSWWYPVLHEEPHHRDVLKELHTSYGRTINKTMFTLLGVGLYCLLKVFGESDKSLIIPNASIQTPLIGTSISFQSFLYVAPFLLVILTIYLHILYGYWLQLERERQQMNKIHEQPDDLVLRIVSDSTTHGVGGNQPTIESIPAIFSFSDPLARLFTNLIFYWFVPLTLWVMARKAFALKELILPFIYVASSVTLSLLFLQIRRCPGSSKQRRWNPLRWVVFGLFIAIMVYAPSVSELLRRPLNLEREDLHGAWLQGLDMADADMNNANLQGANLVGANLKGANLQNTHFQKANLKGAQLQQARLNGANLQGANLGGADFKQADLFSADFREVKEMEPYRIQKAMNWNRAFYRTELLSRLELSPTHNDDLEIIGNYFEGGKIAYILQPGDKGYVEGKRHGLIAAEADITTPYSDVWDKESVTGYYRWSTGQYKNEDKSDYAWQELLNTSTRIGEGAANTENILKKYPASIFPNSAAAVARGYRGGGYSDWFLPSKSELNQLYINRSAVGGFVADYYWSSTEDDADSAWVQGFGGGYQGNSGKSSLWRVRPVRAF